MSTSPSAQKFYDTYLIAFIYCTLKQELIFVAQVNNFPDSIIYLREDLSELNFPETAV